MNSMQQPTGHAAVLKINLGTGKWEAEFQGTILASSPDKNYIKKTIEKGLNKTANACGVTHVIELNEATHGDLMTPTGFMAPTPKHVFPIAERFEFYEETVQMVLDGDILAALVTGPGGLGKSHTTKEVVARNNLDYTYMYEPPAEVKKEKPAKGEDGDDADDEEEEIAWVNPGKVHLVKGYSSAKGLYRTLFENNGKTIIFDDCDSIQKDPNAINILKGALDSGEDRVVSWNAELGRGVNKLPMSFIFTGRIIFISNWAMHKCDEALRTRCSKIDLSMTPDEKVERMSHIIHLDSYLPNIDMEVKEDALNFLSHYKDDTVDLSLRSLQEVIKYRNRGNANWERHALYAITAG